MDNELSVKSQIDYPILIFLQSESLLQDSTSQSSHTVFLGKYRRTCDLNNNELQISRT